MLRKFHRVPLILARRCPPHQHQLRHSSYAAALFQGFIRPEEIIPFPTRGITEDEADNLNTLLDHVHNVTPTPAAATQGGEDSAPPPPTPKKVGKPIEAASLQTLKDWGLLGLHIPEEMGGLGMSNTAHAFVGEHIGMSPHRESYAKCRSHIANCYHLLETIGTRELKGEFFPGMSDGSIIAAWAVTEPGSGNDASMIETTATFFPDEQMYRINGVKCPMSNADNATCFFVLAKADTQSADSEGNPIMIQRLTFFAVEKDPATVKVQELEGQPGRFAVTFKDTAVHSARVIGTVGEGYKDFLVTKYSVGYTHCAVMLGVCKTLLETCVSFIEKRDAVDGYVSKPHSSPVIDTIATLASVLYGLESMLFAFTANMDRKVEDNLVESTLLTTYAAMTARMFCQGAREICGLGTIENKSSIFALIDYLERSTVAMDNIDTTRFFGACCGIEDFGNYFQKQGTIATMQLRTLRSLGVKDKLPNISKQLTNETAAVENAVLKFEEAVESIFVKSGAFARFQHLLLIRVADSCALLLAATAAASRATLASQRGLSSAPHERQLCSLLIDESLQKLNRLSDECVNPGQNADESYARLASSICDEMHVRLVPYKPPTAETVSDNEAKKVEGEVEKEKAKTTSDEKKKQTEEETEKKSKEVNADATTTQETEVKKEAAPPPTPAAAPSEQQKEAKKVEEVKIPEPELPAEAKKETSAATPSEPAQEPPKAL